MTLQSSGAISLSNIAGEFGGSTPHSLSEYYRGGGLVPNHSNTNSIPTSGQISFSQFYGANATAPGVASHSFTIGFGGSQGVGLAYGYNGPTGMGSLSNNPMSTQLSTGLKINVSFAYWNTLCNKGQFSFGFYAIGGPTDGTGFSSIATSYDGTTQRSGLSITGGGNSTTLINVTRSATSTAWPTSGTQTFTIYA
tara:strand:- start:16 stop:600 length:585 start_codon:yes stop_codon:yes gene_type:complete